MNFSLSENQRELKKAATVFAEAKLNDGIEKRDKLFQFSKQGWNACAEFGLQSILVPEQHGGMGLSAVDYAAIMEGIGYGTNDNGLIFSIHAHNLPCTIPLLHNGSDEQKGKYLHLMSSGSIIGAHAITEPDSGSNINSLRTIAKKKKDYFILNGSKTFVTNAPVADLFIVYAVTDKSKGFFGLSCFLVEKESEGLIIGKKIEKMGLRTSPMSDLGFNNCNIPSSQLLGEEGQGGMLFTESMEWERGLILANCIGGMERQLDSCLQYAKDRKSSSQSIGKYQSISNRIAEMKVRLETSRLMLYKVAWLKSNKKSAAMESSAAKLFISESYINNCRDAMKIYGGYGYTTEYELERELRDALASSIYSGTSDIQKNIISSMLL